MEKERCNMFYIFKLILLTTFVSLILSGNIEVKQYQGSWYDAVEHCNTSESRIATIADIEYDGRNKKSCKDGNLKTTKYWIGNYYELSNTISVEGCLRGEIIPNSNLNHALQDGHITLHDCYLQCTVKSNLLTTFAYKNFTAERNCICSLNLTDVKAGVANTPECLVLDRPLWWIYNSNTNEFPVRIENCKEIACTNTSLKDPFLMNILCGTLLNEQTSIKNIRYVCTNNTDDSISTSSYLPGLFSLVFDASITTNTDQSKFVYTKCQTIVCLEESSYDTIDMFCSSNMSGVICLNRTNPLPSTKRTTLISTASSSKNVSMNRSQHPTNNISHITARQWPSQPSSKAQETYASHDSKLYIDATQGYSTSHIHNTTTFNPTPAAQSNATSVKTNMSTVVTCRRTEPNIRDIFSSISTKMGDPSVKKINTTGLLVGLIATAFVIIVIAVGVLLVICRFKRKVPFKNKRFGDDSETQFHGQNYHDIDIASNKEPHTVNNSTYEMQAVTGNVNELSLLEQDSNNIPNSEYAVVIKKGKMIDNVNNQQQSHNEENLNVIENEYDGLNHYRPDSFTDRNNTTNIYDTALGVRDTSDSTYVTANHVHVVDKDENCVYDHM